ncbi:competence protein ComJ [Aureimonas jatrophae]|uniref:Competence protein J (ComJ) n=1 Tax=Aureimonas jatrophae TaxID=1166073 RepID=A0A1H0DGY6_9HYPH|nr:competence protein ComJ [Aureimonas jatrophae]MBB3951880.1 hypothetical protein [Aureimonas jatrophae]SDN69296.1 Competence protein J (ComJ) [Aureimonas jatrophae]
MLAQFLLTVLYTQITVAVPETPAGGLLWTDDHVAQGFAWSPGIASFGVPDHDGQVRITVERSESFRLDAGTLWAVQTPFDVGAAPVGIGTVGDERAVAVPAGRYNLVFEARTPRSASDTDIAYDLHLHFLETPTPSFAILKQGDQIETDHVLSTLADPA